MTHSKRFQETGLKTGPAANLKARDKAILDDNSDPSSDNLDHNIDELICYCFGYTAKDIELDFIKNGRSAIIEKIASEKKTGGCDCAGRNPKGR